jgi:hypothetical protein
MKKDKPPSKARARKYDRFENLERQIIAVPKSEIDKATSCT